MAKVLVNFTSEQVVPNYIATVELRPERVMMMTTREFAGLEKRLQAITGIPHEARAVEPYNLGGDMRVAGELFAELGEDEVVVNFTGGTKIMALAAVVAGLSPRFRERVSLVYVDSRDGTLLTMKPDAGGRMEVKPQRIGAKIPFATLVELAGEKLRSGVAAEPEVDCAGRVALNQLLASEASLEKLFSADVQRQLVEARRQQCRSGGVKVPASTRGSRREAWKIDWNGGDFRAATPLSRTFAGRHPDPAAYFGGLWLEEYVASCLRDAGLFDEVHENLVLQLRHPIFVRTGTIEDKNELDVVVTRGVRAAIIECKAGAVSQDAIFKLAALRDHLLGSFGQAFLVCRFRPAGATRHVLEKARDNNISIIAESDLPNIADLVAGQLQ